MGSCYFESYALGCRRLVVFNLFEVAGEHFCFSRVFIWSFMTMNHILQDIVDLQQHWPDYAIFFKLKFFLILQDEAPQRIVYCKTLELDSIPRISLNISLITKFGSTGFLRLVQKCLEILVFASVQLTDCYYLLLSTLGSFKLLFSCTLNIMFYTPCIQCRPWPSAGIAAQIFVFQFLCILLYYMCKIRSMICET